MPPLPSGSKKKRSRSVQLVLVVPTPVCHSERSAGRGEKCRKKSAWNPAGTDTDGSPHSDSSAASGWASSIQARISPQSLPVST